jgi:hypothetical protein
MEIKLHLLLKGIIEERYSTVQKTAGVMIQEDCYGHQDTSEQFLLRLKMLLLLLQQNAGNLSSRLNPKLHLNLNGREEKSCLMLLRNILPMILLLNLYLLLISIIITPAGRIEDAVRINAAGQNSAQLLQDTTGLLIGDVIL